MQVVQSQKRPSRAIPNLAAIICIVLLGLSAAGAWAIPIGGVEFPEGYSSFADQVIQFIPGNPGPSSTQTTTNALGAPNGNYVTLGKYGTLVLKFYDNFLTGSSDPGHGADGKLDIWVFEVGTNESTWVDVSKDGVHWFNVGISAGATAGLDIDAYGFSNLDMFSYVRLRDHGDWGNTPGADIDAVGAISTKANPAVPEPATLALMGLGLGALTCGRWRRVKRDRNS